MTFYEVVKIKLDNILISDVSDSQFQFIDSDILFDILEIGSP